MKKAIIIICLLPLTASICRKESSQCHLTIKFLNNSANSIYIHASYSYPSTTPKGEFPNPALNPQQFLVLPNSMNDDGLRSRNCYEDGVFGSERMTSDTLAVYVYDPAVLESTPWDTVIENSLYLKRYALSLSDLQNSNWTITYP